MPDELYDLEHTLAIHFAEILGGCRMEILRSEVRFTSLFFVFP